jgi:hypothetical protein
VNLILDSGIALANITAEPLMLAEVAAQLFDRELPLAWAR